MHDLADLDLRVSHLPRIKVMNHGASKPHYALHTGIYSRAYSILYFSPQRPHAPHPQPEQPRPEARRDRAVIREFAHHDAQLSDFRALQAGRAADHLSDDLCDLFTVTCENLSCTIGIPVEGCVGTTKRRGFRVDLDRSRA